jgi:probable F420-dependent oxidoreductase
MKFWLSLMTVNEFDQLPELARTAEALGFAGVTYADHLVMPAKIESKYPYTEDGAVFWPEDTPWPDPWITLAVLGATTTKLRLATNIYLAALRDPFTAAKAVATAAVFSNDRIVCGVSAGWIKEEYDLVGVNFESRGRRLDEMITAMRTLWTGKVVSHRGEFFKFDAIMQPAPKKHIPVWTGGSVPAALRRAARNDGWLGLPMTLAQTIPVIEKLQGYRREAGLPAETMDLVLAVTEPLTRKLIDELERRHAHHLIAMPWFPTPWDEFRLTDDGDDISKLDVKKKAMQRYAEAVISKFS